MCAGDEDLYPIEDEDVDVKRERARVVDPAHINEYAVRLVNLRKCYGAKVAVVNASFGIKRGECFGLLGHNGAG